MEEEKKVFNSPFSEITVTGKENITYFRDYLKNAELRNKLIGAFGESGEYNISEYLKKDLVTCEKRVKSENEKEIIAQAEIKEYVFEFIIEITVNDREKTAYLYLVENIKSYHEDFNKKLKTFISAYTDFDDVYYREKIFSVFHLHDMAGEQKDYDKEKNALEIQEKLKMMKAIQDRVLKEGEEVSKLYLQKMIVLLENSGKKGEYILNQYKKILLENQAKFQKGNKGYYYQLKNILDEVMFSANLELDIKPMQIMRQLQDSFMMVEKSLQKLPQEVKPKKNEQVVVAGGGKKKEKKKNDKPKVAKLENLTLEEVKVPTKEVKINKTQSVKTEKLTNVGSSRFVSNDLLQDIFEFKKDIIEENTVVNITKTEATFGLSIEAELTVEEMNMTH